MIYGSFVLLALPLASNIIPYIKKGLTKYLIKIGNKRNQNIKPYENTLPLKYTAYINVFESYLPKIQT